MEKFKLDESINLYLPEQANESMPWTSSVAHQEIVGQQAVMGVDGHGSIRNETTESNNADNIAEDLDRAIKDMLDPRNVIDLKQILDDKAAKAADESKHAIDKTLDKDNHKATTNKQAKSALKQSLISEYTQIGVEKGETRVVPERVINELSSMLSLSYKELEKRIKVLEEKDLSTNTTIDNPLPNPLPLPAPLPNPVLLPTPKAVQENTPWAAPNINTRKMKSESELQIGNALLEKAYIEGDVETFNKLAEELRNEVVAAEMLSGVKGVEAFDKLIADKRANPHTDSQAENSTNNDVIIGDVGPVVVPVVDVLDYNHENNDIGDLAEDGVEPVEVVAEPTKEKKKRSKKLKATAIGILALVGIGAGIAAYNIIDDNSDKTEVPTDSPDDVANIDFGSASDPATETEDSVENSDVTEADVAALEQSINDRTVEIADTQGASSWDKATALYGDQASTRLIQAAEAVAADGIEVSWSSDPYTSNTAQLSINGTNDPSVVWQFLAPRLAKQDATNFLENAAASEGAETVLPATE